MPSCPSLRTSASSPACSPPPDYGKSIEPAFQRYVVNPVENRRRTKIKAGIKQEATEAVGGSDMRQKHAWCSKVRCVGKNSERPVWLPPSVFSVICG